MQRTIWMCLAIFLIAASASAQVSCPTGQAVTSQSINTGQTCGAFVTSVTATAAALPAGSAPTVTNNGTPSVPNLAFGIPAGASGTTGPAGLTYYLNGTLVTSPVKCNHMTGTTTAAGTYVFNYAGMGFTALVGQPQPSIQGTGTNAYTVNLQGAPTTTSATVYASQSSLVTVVGIQVSLLGLAAAAPVGLWVCGYWEEAWSHGSRHGGSASPRTSATTTTTRTEEAWIFAVKLNSHNSIHRSPTRSGQPVTS